MDIEDISKNLVDPNSVSEYLSPSYGVAIAVVPLNPDDEEWDVTLKLVSMDENYVLQENTPVNMENAFRFIAEIITDLNGEIEDLQQE
jgi:hypothetical protein